MLTDALPSQMLLVRRTHSDEAHVDFARLQRAKLFRRRHVEQVDGDVRTRSAEFQQRPWQQIEVELGKIAEVQLASFPTAQPLHRLHALVPLGDQTPGIDQEAAALYGQLHS